MTDDERPGADPDPSREPAEPFEDDDDYMPLRREGGARSTTALTIGVAVVLLVIVAAIIISSSRKKDDNAARSGTTAVTPGPSDASSTTAAGGFCSDWPDSYSFENTKLEAGKGTPGVYLWSSFDGWHVRLVAGPGVEKVSGILTTESDDLKVKAVGTATAEVQANKATFSIDEGNGTSGFDANISCNTKVLRLEVNGTVGPVSTDVLFIGRQSRATSNPLSAERLPSP